MMDRTPLNHFAGVGAGRTPEIIETIQDLPNRRSGAAHFMWR